MLQCAAEDQFYDEHGFTSAGRAFSAGFWGRLGLYFARHHYLHTIVTNVTAGAALVEIGPGGGSAHLAGRYDVLGVELSSRSIVHAAATYPSVVRSSVTEMPVASGSTDAVVSSYVLEHLDDDDVTRALAEMRRVLRSGGVMVHCFDLAGGGPFHRWAVPQPWYQQVFVASKGHFGLRTFRNWLTLFEKSGFLLVSDRLYCRSWVQDFSVWAALDVDDVHGPARWMGSTAAAVRTRTGWLTDVSVTIFDDLVDRWFPDEWAAKAILVLRSS